jgi:peptidoglycan/xylan/chitin deacetylase (PgdA/CDA1 family)
MSRHPSHLLVLGWHNVEGSWCFPFPPGQGLGGLERQLRLLGRLANVVPLDGTLAALAEGRPLPRRAAALSFDDGYADQLELAVPLLERLGLPATFFLVPGLLSRTVVPWWETLAWAFGGARRPRVTWREETWELGDPQGRRVCFETVAERLKALDRAGREREVAALIERLDPAGDPPPDALFLDWRGAERLARRGFAVGSHSLHHAILSREAIEEQRRDLAAARRQLEQRLGIPVRLLAYPNGRRSDYDQATIAAARAAGYDFALTTLEGWNRPTTPPYEVRRYLVEPDKGTRDLAVTAVRAARDRVR